MIFRRIAEHVKAQNWTAIGVDFVIVVLGVFVATQVSNWNETNRDRHRGDSYLESIHDRETALQLAARIAADAD